MLLLPLLLSVIPIGETTLTGEALGEDLAILHAAFEALHPGLRRYNTDGELEAARSELAEALEGGATLRETYLELTRFLAKIRCGHTYGNFWNQPEQVQEELFGGRDKLPFTFQWVAYRIIVGESARPLLVPEGSEILRIDGRSAADVQRALLPLVSADGSNDGMRRAKLNVGGSGDFETFDCFYPLLFEVGEKFALELREPAEGAFRTLEVGPMTRAERVEVLRARGEPRSESVDDLWDFSWLNESTGYLRLGSFVTWKMSMDWRGFLADAFDELNRQHAPFLVLDLRGNGGGDNDVLSSLLHELAAEAIDLPAVRELVRYRKVPEELNRYLETWDDGMRDLTGRVEPREDGFYGEVGASSERERIAANPEAYAGRVFLLVDATNSSATFQLAAALSGRERFTLVGQETGGNRRGINGGQMFFLRLPNSGIEVDLPLIGYFPVDDSPDAGVLPDVRVERTVQDLVLGRDAELEAALRRVRRGG